jgi:CubicO group peptidase (beta-lactamase class C family)
MTLRKPILGLLLLIGAAPAPDDHHLRALAAGYKSAFLCSDLFTAGRTEPQATADDLEGIYPDLQPLVRALPATVDRAAHTVSVAFDPALPPRIAAWRPGLGCTQLPIGAAPAGTARLPRLTAPAPADDVDRRPWPEGDGGPPPKPDARLSAAVARAFDEGAYGAGTRTTAVLVVQDGRVVAERYADGFGLHVPQRTWSVAKSITATLVGRAVVLGLVKPDAPALIPEWRVPGDPRAAITLAQLLHMNSGLWTAGPGNRTDEVYVGGGAVTQWVTAMPLEASPGTRFRYANNDALLAARSVRAALGDGQRALDFPYRELFWRLDMRHTTAETDWQGNYILSSQVWTTARDLARLGLFYLQDGVWRGERLLPAGWARYVSTPAGAQPEKGAGYGAFFWLYGAADGLPAGTMLMNGNRGQYVFVVPETHTVIVRRGFDPVGQPPFDVARFGRDLLAAVRPG